MVVLQCLFSCPHSTWDSVELGTLLIHTPLLAYYPWISSFHWKNQLKWGQFCRFSFCGHTVEPFNVILSKRGSFFVEQVNFSASPGFVYHWKASRSYHCNNKGETNWFAKPYWTIGYHQPWCKQFHLSFSSVALCIHDVVSGQLGNSEIT